MSSTWEATIQNILGGTLNDAHIKFSPIADATAYPGGRFGQGTGPIFVDNSGCSGNEPRLLSCVYDTHTADCTHAEDAGLRCSGRRKSIKLNNDILIVILLKMN